MSDIIKFPEVSEERKRAIHMSMSYAYSRLEQSQLRFDLPEMISNKAVEAYREERERRIEYALRFLIPQQIKGEITKGKCRYRGLYLKEHDLHLSTSEIEERDGSYILHCRFMFPNICGRKSRSGKRAPFEISLAFDFDTLVLYQAWCVKNEAFAFGGPNCDKSGKYKVSGIAEQIKNGGKK